MLLYCDTLPNDMKKWRAEIDGVQEASDFLESIGFQRSGAYLMFLWKSRLMLRDLNFKLRDARERIAKRRDELWEELNAEKAEVNEALEIARARVEDTRKYQNLDQVRAPAIALLRHAVSLYSVAHQVVEAESHVVRVRQLLDKCQKSCARITKREALFGARLSNYPELMVSVSSAAHCCQLMKNFWVYACVCYVCRNCKPALSLLKACGPLQGCGANPTSVGWLNPSTSSARRKLRK